MKKKNRKKDSKNSAIKMEANASSAAAKEFLIKEKEYEAYLKHIEKLSRGIYNTWNF